MEKIQSNKGLQDNSKDASRDLYGYWVKPTKKIIFLKNYNDKFSKHSVVSKTSMLSISI